MKHLALFLAAFLFAVPARAGEQELLLAAACPPAAAMDPYILMCGHNELVALQAKFCATALVNSWNQAAEAMLPKLQGRGKLGNQDLTEDDSRKNYADAVNSITRQILIMQHYTAVLEDYAKIMIDVPGSTGDETSLSCFNEAFHNLQDVVSSLDKEIVRAKKVRESTMALMNLSNARRENFSGSFNPEAAGSVASGAVAQGQSPRAFNTITGEIRNEFLKVKSSTAEIGKKIPGAGAPFQLKRESSSDPTSLFSIFTPDLSKVPQSDPPKAFVKGKFVLTPPGSVGSVAWKESGNSMKLNGDFSAVVKGGKGSGRRVRFKVAPLVGPAGTVKAFKESNPTPLPWRGAASLRAGKDVAPRDLDLFSVVTSHYRESELFRMARPAGASRGKPEAPKR